MPASLRFASAALAAFLLASAALAQTPAAGSAVFGTVVDETGQPLPGVNVYLSGTTRGAATDVQGRFRIETVPPGAYRLVASFIGYRTGTQDIRVSAARPETGPFAFRLEPVPVTAGEAVVVAEGDARWRRRFERFKTILLGESENAAQTEIENPWVLDFRDRFGALTATASAPLIVTNRALGYRLTYDLLAFNATETRIQYDGSERFELLEPADDAEAARWETARAQAYRGSLRHLMHTLRDGTSEAQGFSFRLRRLSGEGLLLDYVGREVLPAQFSTPVDSVGWYRLRFDGALQVTYAAEPEVPAYLRSTWFREARSAVNPFQVSNLILSGREQPIDPQGNPEDPFGVSASGYLAFERLADLVPAEYVLPRSTAASEIQTRRPPRRGGGR